MVKHKVLVVMALLVLVTSLSACGSSSSQADLFVYSGRTQDLVEPIIERFEQATGLQVEVKYGTSTDLALTIDTEGDRSPADVFFSQTPGAIGFLDTRQRLTPMDPALVNRVEPRYRDAAGNWVGVTGRIRVLAHNPDRMPKAQLPPTVFDLVRPEFKGRVAVAPTNASFQDFITAMRHERGDEAARQWMVAMRDNDSPVYSNNSDIVQAIARGEVDTGLVNHYYAYRLKAEDPGARVENYSFPNGDLGSLLVSADVGIVKGSERVANANRFIQYMLEQDAQRYFANETFEYPLAAGVQPAAALPPLNSIATPNIDLGTLGGDLRRTEQLIEESGIRHG